MTLKQLETTLLKRPRGERAELAEKLLMSLDEALPSEYDAEWVTEVERRKKAVKAGAAKLISASEVKRQVNKILHK